MSNPHPVQTLASTLVFLVGAVSAALGILADAPVVFAGEEVGLTQGELWLVGGITLLACFSLIAIWSSQIARILPAPRWRLRRMLRSKTWQFYFDPTTGTSKEIEFGADKRIYRAPNNNEATWDLNGRILEIYRSDGSLQNSFDWKRSDLRFVSKNDPNCYAVSHFKRKGQYLQPR